MNTITLFLPIILGIIIGYITNVLAIKMLFRPLTEKKLFGIKIPLTPGILPKNRYKLSQNLGDVISEEILSPSVVAQRFRDPDFKKSISNEVKKLTSSFLDTTFDSLFISSNGSLPSAISNVISTAFKSSGARGLIHQGVLSLVKASGSMKLGTIVTEDMLKSILNDFTRTIVASRNKLHISLDTFLLNAKEKNESLEKIIPLPLENAIYELFLVLYPQGFKALISYLESEDAKESMTLRGKEIIETIIERFDGMQKFLISMAGYKKKLDEQMPDIVSDLLETLKCEGMLPNTSKGFANQAKNQTRRLMILPFNDLIQEVPYIEKAFHGIIDYILTALEQDEVRILLIDSIQNAISPHLNISIKEGLSSWFSISDEKASEYITQVLFSFSSSLANKNECNKIFESFQSVGDDYKNRKIGELFGITGDIRASLDEYLTFIISGLLLDKSCDLIKALDIKNVVKEQIDSLDMSSLEKMILDIMKEQFMWIDIFGGILGGLIGCIQVIISLLVK